MCNRIIKNIFDFLILFKNKYKTNKFTYRVIKKCIKHKLKYIDPRLNPFKLLQISKV